LNLTYING